jgi:hypothetical protein
LTPFPFIHGAMILNKHSMFKNTIKQQATTGTHSKATLLSSFKSSQLVTRVRNAQTQELPAEKLHQ